MKKTTGPFLVVLFLLFSQGAAGAPSPETGWMVGLARVKITPDQPLFLAGYAARNKPSEGVLTDLYAKVLALQDAEGRRAVLITADLIGFRAEFAEPLCQRIMQRSGLKRSQILLNASHTHTGPIPTLEARSTETISQQEAEKLVTYTRRLQDSIAEAVDRAWSQLEPVQMSWGTGVAGFVMNRRQHTPDGVILGVNPRGPVDRSVPVLKLAGPDGSLRGVVFGAACHNTTLTGEHYRISADYAGYAQHYVEGQFPGLQAMFLLGCGGDANPYPRSEVKYALRHGQSLGKEVCRLLKADLEPVGGPLHTRLAYAHLPLQAPPPRAEMERMAAGRSWQAFVGRRMMELLERGESLPTYYRAPVAVWQFGNDLTLVGLSGEVVVDYVRLLEDALGPLRLWVAGYCNDVFGYLPSARVLREGGYETRGLIYGGIGFLAPEAQDIVVETVKQLARRD